MSKTQQALAWLKENPGETVYRAAKEHGLSPNTLYTAIARQKAKEGREVCPACGRML